MKIRRRLLLGGLLTSASLLLAVGCERSEEKTTMDQRTAGEKVQGAAEKTGNAVSSGMKSAGDVAGRAVDRSTDAARQAGVKTGEAADTARGAVGSAAQTSGDAVGRAGRATNEWVSPSTAPATAPTNERYPLPKGD